jgi:hypothetical protein
MWNELSPDYVKHMSYFYDAMRRIDANDATALPLLSDAPGLTIVSDFTGAEAASRFETFSFLLAPNDALASWNRHRRELRLRYRLGNRRIAYAKLTDRKKRAAVYNFIRLANTIPGVSVTVLFEKKIKSIFTPDRLPEPSEIELPGESFRRWRPRTLERVLRAVQLVGLFVAGLSGPAQDVTWITDEDDIAPNAESLEDLLRLFAYTLSDMLSHRLGTVSVGTTATTAGDDLATEDLAAVADLIAGSVNTFLCGYGSQLSLSSVISTAPLRLTRKTGDIIGTLFGGPVSLRKFVFVVEYATPSEFDCRQIEIDVEPGVVKLAG